MDSYALSRLYHQCLTKWWLENDSDDIMISMDDIQLEPIFHLLFKKFPVHKYILIAVDGKITCSDQDEIIPSFRSRKYMKVYNKTSTSSMNHIMKTFFELLSIDLSESVLNVLDFMGLLQFMISFQLENQIDLSDTHFISYVRISFSQGPFFVKEEIWRKKYRDPLLQSFFCEKEENKDPHIEEQKIEEQKIKEQKIEEQKIKEQKIDYQSQVLQQVQNQTQMIHITDSYQLIKKLLAMYDLLEERISYLEEQTQK